MANYEANLPDDNQQPPDLFNLFLTAFGHESKTDLNQACSQRCKGKLGNLLVQAGIDNTVLELEADPPADNITYFEHHERAEHVICDGPTRFLGRCTAQIVSTTSGGVEFK